MDLKEFQERTLNLKNALKDIISRYEKDTGFHVKDVHLVRLTTVGQKGSILYDLDLNIDFLE